jgi:methylated-DNA-[protein]-cysteine S-methyltransferase|tara:strand:- start:1 stop:450 length:450 start_codon:yes stop_codon:yes gene_type:complete
MKKSITFRTKYGWISAFEEKGKITEIKFLKTKTKNIGTSRILQKLRDKIQSYFSKKITTFNISLDIRGSLLQKKIWKELKKIPYGKTKSYGEIAKIVKTSPRYVGNVCGQNKHILLIPCHRVIRRDGTLGGFSGTGGLTLKKRLLKLEK